MMKSDSDSNIKSNLAEKYWEFSGEKVGEWTISRKMSRQKEQQD